MSDAITIEIDVPEPTRRSIAACQDKPGLGRRIARAMDRENELTVNRIQQKLTGEVLNVQTGLLRKSIGRTETVVLDEEVQSSVGSGATFGKASVAYAAIHEFGGQTRPHKIVAKNGKALSFGGIFRHSVNHPGSKIPARSYIGSTIADRAPDYARSITSAAGEFMGGRA